MNRNRLATAAIVAASFTLPAPALAAVTNGGFETGDFSGWTLTGNTGFTGVDSDAPHSGSFSAFFGPVGSTASLTQTLTTTPGQSYAISFWLRNESGGTVNFPNSFEALFGGISLMTQTNAGAFGYTQYTLTGTASGASTDLTFRFQNDPSFWDFDDVDVVQAVPEPATWTMLLIGFGAIGLAMRRTRRESRALA